MIGWKSIQLIRCILIFRNIKKYLEAYVNLSLQAVLQSFWNLATHGILSSVQHWGLVQYIEELCKGLSLQNNH